MLTDEQRLEIRQLRAEGLTYDHIGKLVGCSGNTARNIALDVVCPSSNKDTYEEDTETRRIIRRIKRKARYVLALRQKGTLKPCEHCRWNMNKAPIPVCVVCYREVFER